jgi:hypothetical protein
LDINIWTSMSGHGQFDDRARRLWLVRRQLGKIISAPVRKIDDSGWLNPSSWGLSRLQNIQSIAIEQKCVLSE